MAILHLETRCFTVKKNAQPAPVADRQGAWRESRNTETAFRVESGVSLRRAAAEAPSLGSDIKEETW
jgi:hypothetical protein